MNKVCRAQATQGVWAGGHAHCQAVRTIATWANPALQTADSAMRDIDG